MTCTLRHLQPSGHCLTTCWQWPVAKHLEERRKGKRRAGGCPSSAPDITSICSPSSKQSGPAPLAMIESRTLLEIFESKLEETARLFFSNSAITVDLVTIIYNVFFWGLAIPAVIYLLRVERIENWALSDFLASLVFATISHPVGQWAEFQASASLRFTSLLFYHLFIPT